MSLGFTSKPLPLACKACDLPDLTPHPCTLHSVLLPGLLSTPQNTPSPSPPQRWLCLLETSTSGLPKSCLLLTVQLRGACYLLPGPRLPDLTRKHPTSSQSSHHTLCSMPSHDGVIHMNTDGLCPLNSKARNFTSLVHHDITNAKE